MTPTDRQDQRRRRPGNLLALEPRMMFDAAAAVTAQALGSGDAAAPGARPGGPDAAAPGDHAATIHLPADMAVPLDHSDTARNVDHAAADKAPALQLVEALDARGDTAGAEATGGNQIIFIDTSVADYRALASEWAGRGTVVLIDASKDGLDQVRAALAGQTDVGAIHIVSHGAEGVLWLGTTRIDQTAIEGDLSATLGAIGRSLQPGGDILLYGCDFAEGDDGAAALHAFAQATHADVAASTDLTGDARLGGDWVLEAHDGTIDATALAARDWDHVLDPDSPIPIAVKPDSMTVTYNGTTVVSGSTGYGSDARSPDVGVGAVARWTGVATSQGQTLDLIATVVSLSSGDAVRFNRPTSATNGDDPTFLLRDLTSTNDAQVQIQWQLVQSGTTTPVAADVEFGILDIDGIGGKPFTRESVSTSTTGLAYYSRESTTDIYFQSSLDQITASGTQDENADTTKPLSTASEATFDWKNVSTWTLTYTLATNAKTTMAQFYQDGNFDFHYTAPIYTSIPRLDLDANDSTAPGNDAHFTFTEKGAASAIVDTDVTVSNPMDINSVTGGAVRLTNAKAGDQLLIGTLPSGITATTATGSDGTITVTLSGAGSESVYDQAFRAITFANTSRAPDTTQRVIEVSFHNDTLTSAIATSRIDVVAVNDPPERVGTLPDQSAQDAGGVSYATAQAFNDPDGDALSYSVTGLPAGLSIDAATGIISGTIDRSASQATGGQYAVTVTATDPSKASTTQNFTLSVSNPPPVARNDTASTNENTPVRIDVLANDSDPDGDPLTVTAASAGHGSVAINADGTISYTPATYFYGTDSIAYTISDSQGGTSNATVAVTVAHINQAPQRAGTLTDQAAQDAGAVSYATKQAFSDPDGDALTYTASGLPAGLSIDAATGIISGTIDRSASQANGGQYAITVTATDPSKASTTQGFTLSVSNPPPVARNDTASTNENTPVRIDVLANDSDPDGDPLTVTAASAGHGTVAINADGTISYTPATYFYGTDSIAYTISDSQGGTSNATVAVTVAHVNQAPVAAAIPSAYATTDGQAITVSIAPVFSDPDGDTLTYSATGLPAGVVLDAATGVISGTVDRSASQLNGGAYPITLTATDSSGASASRSVTLAVTNPPPVAADDSASTNENTPVTIPVLANDSDPDGDPLTVTAAAAQHGSVAINADGTLAYAPAQYFYGTDTIAYTISDGQGGTSSATVTVAVAHVNQAPQPVGTIADVAAQDAGTVSYTTAQAFGDPDGDALTYSASGLPAGLSIDSATGVISDTIDRSASQASGGRYAVTVTATDPSKASTTQGFTLSVSNPPPVAKNDSASTNENTSVVIPVLANDTDPDGDPLKVSVASAGHGTVAINADGTLAYTPAQYFYGTDTIAYTTSDGQGGTSDATVTVAVAHVNQAPQPVGTIADVAAQDADTVSYATAQAFGDRDGDALTYTASGLPAGLAIDSATGIISGTIDRSASQASGGRYAVTVTAADPSKSSATQGFTLSVSNPPPVAQNDSASTNENTSVVIPVLANDSDPDGDPLMVTGASAGHGSVSINGDGTLAYTPTQYFYGTDTIAYTISDGQGGTSDATVAVTVAHVDQAPVRAGTLPDRAAQDAGAVSYPTTSAFADPDGDALTYAASGLPAGLSIDAATGVISGTIDHSASQASGGRYAVNVTATDPSGLATSQGFTLTVANPPPVAVDDPLVNVHPGGGVRIAVLGNDSDPDGDPLTVTAASADHGSVAIDADGTITYTADPAYAGSDTIRYTIGDGQGGTASATVPVTIGDHAPTADPLPSRSASDAQVVSLPLAGAFHDADGDPLTFGASGLPAGLTIDPATGVISGTIDRSASQVNGGVYAGTITANDGHGGTVSTPLRWTVGNPSPVAADDRATTAEDTPVTIPVLANDGDPDGDPLTVTGASAAHGSVAVNADGTLTYTPAPDYNGADVIHYSIGDGQGGTSSASVAETVTPVNDPPHAVGTLPAQRASDGDAVSIATAPGFTDADGDTLTYSATGLPAGLTIDPATGVIGGRLAPDASARSGGASTIIVTATDPSGASATQTVSLVTSHPAPVTVGDTATTLQETPVTIAVLANDASPSGAALAVTGATAGHGTVAINPDGTIAYTPAYGFRGTDTIHYTVTDAAGGTSTADVTVAVTPINHAPAAVAPLPDARASDGAAVRLDLGGYFADRDGDALRYAAAGLPAGLTIDPATGVISGTLPHDASGSGPYHVTITATDPSGASSASSFDWSIVHPAPVPLDDVAGTAANTPVSIAVLVNDRDPAGDPLTVTAATASHGVATIGPDGVLQYTPGANFTGQDVVTYTVTDSDGASAQASVLVTVTPPPVAHDGGATTTPGCAVTVPVLTLASDPAGLPLTVASVTADHGTATVDPDGGVRYVPGPGFVGTDTIRYTVADANGGMASALVTVVVASTDRPPVVPGRDPIAVIGGQPTRLGLLTGVSDPDGDPLTIVDASAAVGTLVVAPDGTATYTAPLGFSGTTTVSYSVSDGRGGSTSATLVIRVADGRGADINELLRIGQVRFLDPAPSFARVAIGDGGEVRNPLTLLRAAEAIRPLGATTIGEHPVDDAVNDVRWLQGTGIDPAQPIAGEVRRLDALADRRDAAERLLDPRWGDFLVRGLTGFSAASDAKAGIMVESVVRGDALYLEVRDTAAGRQPPVRSIDVRLSRGGRAEWIRVDHRGLAIIERSADRDELHLLVTVTRTNGCTTTTPIVVQGATGEVEIDHPSRAHAAARPLHATLTPPHSAITAEADRLASSFE